MPLQWRNQIWHSGLEEGVGNGEASLTTRWILPSVRETQKYCRDFLHLQFTADRNKFVGNITFSFYFIQLHSVSPRPAQYELIILHVKKFIAYSKVRVQELCVKVDLAVLGSPSQTVLMVSAGVKQH